MPEHVEVREDWQVIHVVSVGDVSADELKRTLESVIRLHRETGLSRVLVDTTSNTSYPSTMDSFDFGQKLAATASDLRFAVLAAPRADKHIRFIETVARNRGLMARIFAEEADALAWLKKGEAEQETRAGP